MPKAYQVQFTLPVDNPEDNVVKIIRRTVIHFEVPVNYPSFEQVGYAELLRVAKVKELLTESTGLNKKKRLKPTEE